MQGYENVNIASGRTVRIFQSAFGILHVFGELGPSDTLRACTAFG